MGYTAKDWLAYGDQPNPSTREKMILLAIEEIIELGPADFNTNRVCDRLDIKHPMVNHYFGNRDGLIAEATWWVYQHWAAGVDAIMHSAMKNPRKRLEKFIRSEIAFSKRMGGMLLLLHYPISSKGSQEIVDRTYGDQMQRYFQYHLALLAVTVRDIRSGKVTPLDFDLTNFPTTELLATPSIVFAASQISWMTHGVAMWSSGHHLGSDKMDNPAISKLTTAIALDEYIKLILKVAEKEV